MAKVHRREKERLSSSLAESLQNRIVEKGLPPGARLPTETGLMNEFRVSRTVVREAAAILAGRGLVEVRPRRGMSVRQPDPAIVTESIVAILKTNSMNTSQLLDVRLTLETAIAGTAAVERSQDDVKRLEECLRDSEEALHNQAESLRLDMLFHQLLADATHNPFYVIVTSPVTAILRDMYERSFGYLALQPVTLAEHQEIFTAVSARDAEWAKVAVACHLRRVGNSVRQMIEKETAETSHESASH